MDISYKSARTCALTVQRCRFTWLQRVRNTLQSCVWTHINMTYLTNGCKQNIAASGQNASFPRAWELVARNSFLVKLMLDVSMCSFGYK
eukprot:205915-Amphidinium_carterae.1